jgi:hypothetical protein
MKPNLGFLVQTCTNGTSSHIEPVLLAHTGGRSHAIPAGHAPLAAPDPDKRQGPVHAAAAAPTAAAVQAQPPGTAGLPCVQSGAAAALHGFQVRRQALGLVYALACDSAR